MVGDKDRPGYDIVRETWKPILGEAEFDKKWNRVLHDGVLAGSELTEVVPDVKGEAFAELARAAGAASGLEIVFVPSPSLHDGRFAKLEDVIEHYDRKRVVSVRSQLDPGVLADDVKASLITASPPRPCPGGR